MIDATLCILVRTKRSGPQAGAVSAVCLGYKKRGFGQGKLVGFGGKVGPGEQPLQAAARELAEETGLRLPETALRVAGTLTFRFPHRPTWEQRVHVYLYVASTGAGDAQESEEMRPRWFPVRRLPYAEMWPDARHWLPFLLNGQRLTAEFVYAEDDETLKTVKIESDGRQNLFS
jgi:8-oxo-dGTP diphosphatase